MINNNNTSNTNKIDNGNHTDIANTNTTFEH